MKTYTVLWLLFCFASLTQGIAQQSPTLPSTNGGSSVTENIQLDWAVGEPFVATLNSPTGFITEGLLQPNIVTLPPAYEESTSLTISLAPNPTNSALSIDFNTETEKEIRLSVFDMSGNLIGTQLYIEPQGAHNYDMRKLVPGMYLFRFQGKQKRFLQTMKVIKIQ